MKGVQPPQRQFVPIDEDANRGLYRHGPRTHPVRMCKCGRLGRRECAYGNPNAATVREMLCQGGALCEEHAVYSRGRHWCEEHSVTLEDVANEEAIASAETGGPAKRVDALIAAHPDWLQFWPDAELVIEVGLEEALAAFRARADMVEFVAVSDEEGNEVWRGARSNLPSRAALIQELAWKTDRNEDDMFDEELVERVYFERAR